MDANKLPSLIALYSPAPQSGKTTVANYLCAGFGYERLRFAYPLKTMVYALMFTVGIDEERAKRYVEGDLKDEWVPELKVTARSLMQTLGSEWGRKCVHENLWVDALERTLVQKLDAGAKIVIDDMRFQNEFDLMGKLGGTTIKVQRRTMNQIPLHNSEGVLTHQEFDYIFQNQGTIEDLHQQVLEIVA